MLLAVKKRPALQEKKAHKSGHWTLKVSIPFHVSMSRLWEGKSSVSVVARDCIQLWHCHRSLFPAASTSTAAAPARRTTLGQDEVGFLFLPPQAELHHSPWYNCKTNLSLKKFNINGQGNVFLLLSILSKLSALLEKIEKELMGVGFEGNEYRCKIDGISFRCFPTKTFSKTSPTTSRQPLVDQLILRSLNRSLLHHSHQKDIQTSVQFSIRSWVHLANKTLMRTKSIHWTDIASNPHFFQCFVRSKKSPC